MTATSRNIILGLCALPAIALMGFTFTPGGDEKKADEPANYVEAPAPAPGGDYTGPFHEEHVKKIVFSKEPIIVGKEDPSKMTTEFTAGDKIYCVAYFKKPLKARDLSYDGNSLKILMYVDFNPIGSRLKASLGLKSDAQQVGAPFDVYEPEREYNYLTYELVVDADEYLPDQENTKDGSKADVAAFLATLSPKKHKINVFFSDYSERTTIAYIPVSTEIMAKGTITLDCSKGTDMLKVRANYMLEQRDAYDKNFKKQLGGDPYDSPSKPRKPLTIRL